LLPFAFKLHYFHNPIIFLLDPKANIERLRRSYSGLAVLEVIRNEKLVCSAKMVGRFLQQQLTSLKER
jgi:hypothetical protein